MTSVEFGATPWGRAWVRTIESTAATVPNPSLPAARSLARNHAVTVTTATGRLDAEVAVAGTVHRVRIDLSPWSGRTEAAVHRLVAAVQAGGRGLAAGDLPDTLATDLARHGIGIAAGPDEQVAECGCRSRRRPCVHLLATVYALAQLIDERPALALELRSRQPAATAVRDAGWIELTAVNPQTYYGEDPRG